MQQIVVIRFRHEAELAVPPRLNLLAEFTADAKSRRIKWQDPLEKAGFGGHVWTLTKRPGVGRHLKRVASAADRRLPFSVVHERSPLANGAAEESPTMKS